MPAGGSLSHDCPASCMLYPRGVCTASIDPLDYHLGSSDEAGRLFGFRVRTLGISNNATIAPFAHLTIERRRDEPSACPSSNKAVSVTDFSVQLAIEQMPCQVVRGIFTRFCAPDSREVWRFRAFCQHGVRAGCSFRHPLPEG